MSQYYQAGGTTTPSMGGMVAGMTPPNTNSGTMQYNTTGAGTTYRQPANSYPVARTSGSDANATAGGFRPFKKLTAGLEESEMPISYLVLFQDLPGDRQKEWRQGNLLFAYNAKTEYAGTRHNGVVGLTLPQLNQMLAEGAAAYRSMIGNSLRVMVDNSRAQRHEQSAAVNRLHSNFYRGQTSQMSKRLRHQGQARTPKNFSVATVEEFRELYSLLGYFMEEQNTITMTQRMIEIQHGGKMTVPNIWGNVAAGEHVGLVVKQTPVSVENLPREPHRLFEALSDGTGLRAIYTETVRGSRGPDVRTLARLAASPSITHASTVASSAARTKTGYRKLLIAAARALNPYNAGTFLQVVPYVGRPHHNTGADAHSPSAMDLDARTGAVVLKSMRTHEYAADLFPMHRNAEKTNGVLPNVERQEKILATGGPNAQRRYKKLTGGATFPQGVLSTGKYIHVGVVAYPSSPVSAQLLAKCATDGDIYDQLARRHTIDIKVYIH